MSTGYIKNLLLILNFKSAVYGKRHLKKVPQIGTNLLKCIFLLSYIFSPQDQPEEEGRDELLHQRTQQGKQKDVFDQLCIDIFFYYYYYWVVLM